MTTPSLLVLIISGWGISDNGSYPFFYNDKYQFLENYITSYPSALYSYDGVKGLSDVYQIFSGYNQTKDPSRTVSSLLSSHNIEQFKLAFADRYGYLTQEFNGGIDFPYPDEYWEYFSYPSGPSLSETLTLSLNDYEKLHDPFIYHTQGSVIYSCLSSAWSLSVYDDINAIKHHIKSLEDVVMKLSEKALSRGLRVLLLSDGPIHTSRISKEVNKNLLLPSILLSPKLEGVASEDEIDFINTTIEATVSISQIPTTILKLMEVFVPSDFEPDAIFDSLISQTL